MRHRQAGVTLIELLVSSVIVVIITGAMTRAFVAGFDYERTSEQRRTFEVTRPAVSQHLTILKEVGLLTERRAGTRRLYRGRRAALAAE